MVKYSLPWAVELTLDLKGIHGSVKADNIDYHFINSNEGYEEIQSHTSVKHSLQRF